jgi:hypothetical protein
MKLAGGELPAELCRGAAIAVGQIGEADDAHRETGSDLDRPIDRAGIGDDDLGVVAFRRRHDRGQAAADILLFVEAFDDDRQKRRSRDGRLDDRRFHARQGLRSSLRRLRSIKAGKSYVSICARTGFGHALMS